MEGIEHSNALHCNSFYFDIQMPVAVQRVQEQALHQRCQLLRHRKQRLQVRVSARLCRQLLSDNHSVLQATSLSQRWSLSTVTYQEIVPLQVRQQLTLPKPGVLL